MGLFEPINEDSSVEEIEKEAWKIINGARKLHFNVAADNLEYYLSGKRLDRKISRRWLRSFKRVRQAERLNQIRFQRKIVEFAHLLNKHNAIKTYIDNWDHLISYFGAGTSTEELFFASGDSTYE